MKKLPETGSVKPAMLACIVAGALAAGGVAVWLWQSGAPDEVVSVHAAAAPNSASARFGPGAWTGAAASAAQQASAVQPPQRPNITPDGKLVIDHTLHQDFDFFLLGGLPGDRNMHAAQLHAYLNNALPAAAGKEATQIADRYLLYMKLHDDLLARQALPQWVDLPSPAEAERVTNWVVQRTRLRQTVLGNDVVQAWYAEEEAAIQAGLAEFDTNGSLAVMMPGNPDQAGNDAPTGRAARMQDAGHEARREQFLRHLTEEASRSYVVVERERQLNAARVANASS